MLAAISVTCCYCTANHLKTQQLKTIRYYVSQFCRLWTLSRQFSLEISCSWGWGWCRLKAKLGWASRMAHSSGRQLMKVQLRLDQNIHRQALHVAWASRSAATWEGPQTYVVPASLWEKCQRTSCHLCPLQCSTSGSLIVVV